jgi:hypothetical protein
VDRVVSRHVRLVSRGTMKTLSYKKNRLDA